MGLGRPTAARAAARAVLSLADGWPAEELRQRAAAPTPDLVSEATSLASGAIKSLGQGVDAVGQELEDLLLGRTKRKK